MEQFTEEHSKHLLSKEWLVKTDNQTSTAYLFKYHFSSVDLSCCVLLTDTRSAWAEVLTSGQFARRWRDCNRETAPPYHKEQEEEDEWRETVLEQLTSAHSLGGVTDFSFEVTTTAYSDLAFTLESNYFKWRWETCFLGHKTAAEVISKHLIYPLISTAHLAFSSTDSVGELPDKEVEKAVDKVGRTARRAVDTHIKNALSKPRLATSLRRMTATFHFVPELPPVISSVEKPDFQAQGPVATSVAHHESPVPMRAISPQPRKAREPSPLTKQAPAVKSPLKPPPDVDSATESEEDAPMSPKKIKTDPTPLQATPSGGTSAPEETHASPPPLAPRISEKDSSPSPPRPTKKLKKQPVSSSSDDDSEEERKRQIAQITGGSGPQGVRRGTKQPIKRGGKRF